MRWLLSVATTALLICPVGAQAPPEYPAPVKVKAAFLKLLDRPKVPLDVKETAPTTKAGGGLVLEHLSFASEQKADGSIERVPLILLRPEKVDAKMPAVIVLHGTGGSKDGQLGFMKELAKRGMIGVAIDARYHGARAAQGKKGAATYNEAITRAWKTKPGEPMEHPFYFDTCWDIWRTVDYLATRSDARIAPSTKIRVCAWARSRNVISHNARDKRGSSAISCSVARRGYRITTTSLTASAE